MTKILITSPIRNQEYCLQEYLNSLIENEEYAKSKIKDLHIDYYFITYNNLDNTAKILNNFTKGRVKELKIKEDSTREYVWHDWTKEQLKNLGDMRDACLKEAKDYDYAFMVDGDVKLQKETLWKLLKESKGEHVLCTIVLANWDKHLAFLVPNYEKNLLSEMDSNHPDDLTGFTPSSNEIIENLQKKTIIETQVHYMVWLIPSKLIRNNIASFTSPDGRMEFKWFSKYLRDGGIKQLIDFTYPGTHMEKSGSWISTVDISSYPPKILIESKDPYGFLKIIKRGDKIENA